ncbi:hypothetical protein D9M71_813420 [compost metagenome]
MTPTHRLIVTKPSKIQGLAVSNSTAPSNQPAIDTNTTKLTTPAIMPKLARGLFNQALSFSLLVAFMVNTLTLVRAKVGYTVLGN